MKIKAVDIAKKLNISKSAVSLALNNKPGVSEQTRDAVFRCIAQMEQENDLHSRQKIKIINIKREHYKYAEMDLWEDVMYSFDRVIRQMGYTMDVIYADLNIRELQHVIRQTNEENVAGLIYCATEFQPEEFKLLNQIRKPLAIFDNDSGGKYHCSVIGNVEAMRNAVDYLVSKGCKSIKYLGNSVNIYNFRERRAGYRAGMRKNKLELRDDSILLVGKTTDEIYHFMLSYLQRNRLPDAFLMDNYQVSIGVMRALKELQISVPDEVSLIGFDEIPSFVMADYQLTTVKVRHSERARALMQLLEQEIKGYQDSKFKLVSYCELVHGNSVRDKNAKD